MAGAAEAQVSASAAIDSDYRVRGVSFSDGRPAGSLTLTLDHSSGFYAGLTGIAGDTDRSGLKPLGYQLNAGYAVRTHEGWSIDLGVSAASFTQYLDQREQLRYSEIYAGVTTENLSAHLYYSPDYLGRYAATLYGEVNGALPLKPNLRLVGHAGLLAPLGSQRWAPLSRPRFDAEAGAALSLKQAELRLAWSHAQYGDGDPHSYLRGGDALLARLTYAF